MFIGSRCMSAVLRTALLATSVLGVSACTWVELKPGAERVVMLDAFQAKSCEKIGSVSTGTAGKIAFFERDDVKVQNELLGLARNEALGMGGNAIAPKAKSKDAKQSFFVYRCP